MSFTSSLSGQGYEPGYFLANNEDCTRETRQFAANSDLVKTNEMGGKCVPMGTAYPSNDGYAVGITYEDVDVTNGNAPGSVVTKGEVYEDKLAITGQTYTEASVTSADDPTTEGWYEKSGDTYSLSTDTVASRDKKYYESDGDTTPTYTQVETIVYGDNPKTLGLYERSGTSPNFVYTLSTDTQADGAKTYYEVSGFSRLSDSAKSALIALGFKFRSSANVTRPNFS